MIVLGINGGFGGGYQDACAALINNGKLVAAIEEERLSGVKFSPGVVPFLAINAVLKMAGLSMADIDVIAFHGASWRPDIEDKLKAYFLHHWGCCPKIQRHFHHDAHAASAFYASGWEEALVVTFDNSGDGISTQICRATAKGGLELLKQFQRPNSLGTFFGAMTQLSGFRRDADEYKLMGLSAYGDPQKISLDDILQYDGAGGYTLSASAIRGIAPNESFPQKQIPLYTEALRRALLGNRYPGELGLEESLTADLAAAAQYQLEKTAVEMIRFWLRKTGLRKVCLAGGVALNCAMNRKIRSMEEVDSLFVPPYAGDQGISIGAAILSARQSGDKISPATSAFTGIQYSDREIRQVLAVSGVRHQRLSNPAVKAASLLQEGKIIAWHQGRSEIGPRALGNRSILASAQLPGMKDAINARIKFREAYRPFCPSVLEEDAGQYFDLPDARYPYMNVNGIVREAFREVFPDITHVDGTARLQTVSAGDHPLYHELLLEVKRLSGHGMVINTSFNVRNHPMAESPSRALECFFSSGLDALIIGDYLVDKA